MSSAFLRFILAKKRNGKIGKMITNKFKKKGVVESDDEEVSINLDNDTYPDMSPSFVVMAPPSGDPTATYVNATRIIAIAMSLIIFFSMASRPGLGNIFSWHPIFMTLGCIFFMTEGMMAYVSRVPEVSRAVARKKHAKYQILALACIMLGYMAVFISHEKNSKSHLGLNDDTTFSRGIHVFLGLLILILCVVQGVFGIRKYLRYVALYSDPITHTRIYIYIHKNIGTQDAK